MAVFGQQVPALNKHTRRPVLCIQRDVTPTFLVSSSSSSSRDCHGGRSGLLCVRPTDANVAPSSIYATNSSAIWNEFNAWLADFICSRCARRGSWVVELWNSISAACRWRPKRCPTAVQLLACSWPWRRQIYIARRLSTAHFDRLTTRQSFDHQQAHCATLR